MDVEVENKTEQEPSFIREEMEFDVLIVGGGTAGLSAALKISDLIEQHNKEVEAGSKKGPLLNEVSIGVLEKASQCGDHSLSGAVLNPCALEELVPRFKEESFPIEAEINNEFLYYLGEKKQFKIPFIPAPFHNKGFYLVSASKMNRWLAQRCEEKGINILPSFAAVKVLYDDKISGNKVIGVQTGDKGLDKNGKAKSNFEAGYLLKAKVVLFAEGPRGSLFKKHCEKLNLPKSSYPGKNKHPDIFEEGVKEVIQMPPGTVRAGQVYHTMGFPLCKSIGGSFIYTLKDDKIVVGLVAYLDSQDPLLDPHHELQKLKTHPFMKNLLKGGKVISYGAKTIPAGGWYSVPPLFGDGWLVLGDSAGLVDAQKLKGLHLAMKSGILAAETVFEALLKENFDQVTLKEYENKVQASYIKKELYRVRNFHQALKKGFLRGIPLIALQELTGGRGLCDPMPVEEDFKATRKISKVWGSLKKDEIKASIKTDGVLFFDKLSSVYLTGTRHDEDSPNHLHIKNTKLCIDSCYSDYKAPCTHFCPAEVYEFIKGSSTQSSFDSKNHNSEDKQQKEQQIESLTSSANYLQINFTNCIHCKTCDIKCPFDNITWKTPEGGGGPQYQDT